jgi:hypothetical protein
MFDSQRSTATPCRRARAEALPVLDAITRGEPAEVEGGRE